MTNEIIIESVGMSTNITVVSYSVSFCKNVGSKVTSVKGFRSSNERSNVSPHKARIFEIRTTALSTKNGTSEQIKVYQTARVHKFTNLYSSPIYPSFLLVIKEIHKHADWTINTYPSSYYW